MASIRRVLCTYTLVFDRVHDFGIPFSKEKAVNNTEQSSIEEREITPTYLIWEEQIE